MLEAASHFSDRIMFYIWLLVGDTAGGYDNMAVVRLCHLPKVADRLDGAFRRTVGWVARHHPEIELPLDT